MDFGKIGEDPLDPTPDADNLVCNQPASCILAFILFIPHMLITWYSIDCVQVIIKYGLRHQYSVTKPIKISQWQSHQQENSHACIV